VQLDHLRLPLAASLLLHAVLLGLVALGLPRGLPGQETSLEVRLVSLEAGEGAGGATAGLFPPGPEPRAAPPAAVTPPAPLLAPLPAAPAPPAQTADPPAAREPLAIEGPKVTTPDGAFSTPSGFNVPQSALVREGDLASGGAAAGGGSTAPHEERLARGRGGVPDGKGLAGEGGGGAAETAGALARAREGGLGAAGDPRGQGDGAGTGSPGAGTGRDGTIAEILRRIEAAKRYPEEARRLGHRGTVAVRFRIGSDGTVAAAEVAASSGSSLLDAASLETVRRAAPLPLTPGWLLVRISYGLTEARP
jgi:protein TonB